MSAVRGFVVLPTSREQSTEWLELYQSGRQDKAAQEVVKQQREATMRIDEAIDERVESLAAAIASADE